MKFYDQEVSPNIKYLLGAERDRERERSGRRGGGDLLTRRLGGDLRGGGDLARLGGDLHPNTSQNVSYWLRK